MNCRMYVTNIILPIVLMATITHFTTYYNIGKVNVEEETMKQTIAIGANLNEQIVFILQPMRTTIKKWGQIWKI